MSAKNAQTGFYEWLTHAFSIKKSTLKRFKVRSWKLELELGGRALAELVQVPGFDF